MIDIPNRTRNLSARPGTPDDRALVLERVFEAPPDTVFRLWADPEHVKEWWHPDGYSTPEFEMDFRIGGTYRYCIRKDGRDGWAHGTYREIDAPHRIAFTFQWDTGSPEEDAPTLVTLSFEPDGADGHG